MLPFEGTGIDKSDSVRMYIGNACNYLHPYPMDAKFTSVPRELSRSVLCIFKHTFQLVLSSSHISELVGIRESTPASLVKPCAEPLLNFIVDALGRTFEILRSDAVSFVVQPECWVRMADGVLLRSVSLLAMLTSSEPKCSCAMTSVLAEDILILPITVECPWIASETHIVGGKKLLHSDPLLDCLSKSILCIARALSTQLLEVMQLSARCGAGFQSFIEACGIEMFTVVASTESMCRIGGGEKQNWELIRPTAPDLVCSAVAASTSCKWIGYAYENCEPRDYRPLAIANSADTTGKCMLHKLLALPANALPGRIGLVRSNFEYFHYNCDGFTDAGWGCAYRTLQSIVSWYKLHTKAAIAVPHLRDLQRTLVTIGDKPASFVDSNEWIGSVEASYILGSLLGLECQVLQLQTLADIVVHEVALIAHFDLKGPMLLSGGTKAYTLAGLAATSEEVYLLILDPHYIGPDSIDSAIVRTVNMEGYHGSAVSWRRISSFPAATYRICIPQ
jgi:hypothetical protein